MSNYSNLYNDLFSSLISEVKNYNGKDPLLPWLRGIGKMKEVVPPQLLNEKLPRFLQKCAQTFLNDRRYTNDLRYLRVWLQLMDYVKDPKTVLRTMEANRVGMQKSLFYQAYALYFEKMKKFEAAEKMYHVGVQNLAEPVGELQKSHEQFLHRMARHKIKRNHGGRTSNVPPSFVDGPDNYETGGKENLCRNAQNLKLFSQKSHKEMLAKDANHAHPAANFSEMKVSNDSTLKREVMGKSYSEEIKGESSESLKHYSDDTVVAKFVDIAIDGKSDAEDARHHGLVEPTIYTKEAMNAINNMFREPLEPSFAGRRSVRSWSKTDKSLNNGLQIFVDGKLETEVVPSGQNLREDSSLLQTDSSTSQQPLQEPLQIFIDDEENENVMEMVNAKDKLDQNNDQSLRGGCKVTREHFNGFGFPHPLDVPWEGSDDLDAVKPQQPGVREDTIVYRFIGSTISNEPEVENVCHHGLVEPSITMKYQLP